MFMNREKFSEAPATAIGQALRAVERQKSAWPLLMSADARAQRAALFHYLDASAADLFTLVAEAAEAGHRQICLLSVPLLAERLPVIFPHGTKRNCDASMFNDWLTGKDLSHLFYTDGLSLNW